MTLLFKVGNKPKNPPTPEMVEIKHGDVVIEMPKLGSLTYGETMGWNDFRASLETRTVTKKNDVAPAPIFISQLSTDRYILIACLVYAELRAQTLNPKYKANLAIARQVAEGASPESLGLCLEDDTALTPELMLEIYTQFWQKEIEGWGEKPSAEKQTAGNESQ